MFFFSSRRRHTRLQGDWSSDVCSSDLTSALRIQLSRDSHLYAQSTSDINLLQVGADATINGSFKFIDDLYVARVSANDTVTIEVAQGDMTVDRVQTGGSDAGDHVSLKAQDSIKDATDDAGSPLLNVTSVDVYLEATTGAIGTSSNFFDVLASGDLSGLAGGNVFLNSPANLNITTSPGLRSTGGNVTLTVQGDTN